MSTANISPDNLDDFESLFVGKATAVPHVTDEPELPLDDVKEDNPEDEPLAPEGDDTPEDVEDSDEKPDDKPKKKSTAQERFNELTAARRAAEREAEAERRARELLEQRLAEIEAKLPKAPEPANVTPQAAGEPSPDDVNEDGEPKYPLGEYDPKFIRDLTRYESNRILEEKEARAAQEAAQRQADTAKAALQEQWLGKIEAIQDTIPDIREQADKLDTAFAGIEPTYGEYLANTIMQMDHGPEVLYYLANNLDEARVIAAAGPLKATLALGEIHSQFKSKPKPEPKVTNAPEPPPIRARGTSGKFMVSGDTDDLNAFESVFYGK